MRPPFPEAVSPLHRQALFNLKVPHFLYSVAYEAMLAVDLGLFFHGIDTYHVSRCVLIAERLSRLSQAIPKGAQVLDFGSLSAYVMVCLTLVLGPSGSLTVTSLGYSDHLKINTHFEYLLTSHRLRSVQIQVLTSDPLPFQVILVPDKKYDHHLVGRLLEEGGTVIVL
jgi:hypothetical protein